MSTSRGSHFMTELLAALAESTKACGQPAELALDRFPPLADDLVYIAIPHEFAAWGDRDGAPDAGQRARTIALCTENPGTIWFEETLRSVGGFAAAVSINRSSAAELRRRGIDCQHIQIGYCARWDRWGGGGGGVRPLDVLYLAAADPRRDPLLAGIGMELSAHRCQFLVPPLEPRRAPRADFLTEDDKYARLAEAKVLLNLHRTSSAAFEWMRFLEAICNGCVVVTEPSLDSEPLLPGVHFAEAPAEGLAGAVEGLLNDPERLSALREDAYEFVRRELPMEHAAQRLIALSAALLGAPEATLVKALNSPEPVPGERGPSRATHSRVPPSTDRAARAADARRHEPGHGARTERAGPAWDAASAWHPAPVRPSSARASAELLRSAARRLRPGRSGGSDILASTPAYRPARPRVTALVHLEGSSVGPGLELLGSLVRSHCAELEIVISCARPALRTELAIRALLGEHGSRPILALAVERTGLGAARNLLAQRARAEHLLVLPAAGGVFPATVPRLLKALERDPPACFSYAMVAVLVDDAPVELRGSLPWEPGRLTRTNWIDPPALVRREWLLRLGGYTTDQRLSGLEDFDLWCRCADASEHGAHVPQVLAWHPPEDDAGPRELAALDPSAVELLRARAPRLFSAA